MDDLATRALRKRIHVRCQFTYRVPDHVTVDDGLALVRMRRPAKGRK